MDRKQIHKIGKVMNKPVKFIKKNSRKILTGISAAASLVALINGRKNRLTITHRIQFE